MGKKGDQGFKTVSARRQRSIRCNAVSLWHIVMLTRIVTYCNCTGLYRCITSKWLRFVLLANIQIRVVLYTFQSPSLFVHGSSNYDLKVEIVSAQSWDCTASGRLWTGCRRCFALPQMTDKWIAQKKGRWDYSEYLLQPRPGTIFMSRYPMSFHIPHMPRAPTILPHKSINKKSSPCILCT